MANKFKAGDIVKVEATVYGEEKKAQEGPVN